jgi:hypothetical protein
MRTRTVRRPRRYVDNHWLTLLGPALRYSSSRDAYVLRVVGAQIGPVLRLERRARQRYLHDLPDRRRARAA